MMKIFLYLKEFYLEKMKNMIIYLKNIISPTKNKY